MRTFLNSRHTAAQEPASPPLYRSPTFPEGAPRPGIVYAEGREVEGQYLRQWHLEMHERAGLYELHAIRTQQISYAGKMIDTRQTDRLVLERDAGWDQVAARLQSLLAGAGIETPILVELPSEEPASSAQLLVGG